MPILLNTIALDPHRWTADKIPYFVLADLLPRIAEAGFRSLEVWQYHLSTLDAAGVDRLAEQAGALGIGFPVVGLYPALHHDGDALRDERARMRQVLDDAARLGARRIKIFAGLRASSALDASAYSRSIAFVRDLAAHAHWLGMDMTAETHANTLCDGVEATLRFLDDADSPHLSLCFQPYDFTDTDGTLAAYDALHDRVTHLHLQGRRSGVMAHLDEADIDYDRLFVRLGKHGFAGDIGIEFVKDCVVPEPEALDLDLVLANARHDRAYAERHAAAAGIAY